LYLRNQTSNNGKGKQQLCLEFEYILVGVVSSKSQGFMMSEDSVNKIGHNVHVELERIERPFNDPVEGDEPL